MHPTLSPQILLHVNIGLVLMVVSECRQGSSPYAAIRAWKVARIAMLLLIHMHMVKSI